MLSIPDVILTVDDDELIVDLDIKTKLPRPVVVPTAVASFNALLFKVTTHYDLLNPYILITPLSMFPLDILKSTPSIAAVTLQYPATKVSLV